MDLKYQLKPLDSKSYHFNNEYEANVPDGYDQTSLSEENEAYEVSDEADLEKEMGSAITLKKKKKNSMKKPKRPLMKLMNQSMEQEIKSMKK